MPEGTASVPARKSFRFSRNQTIGLVFGCSVFGTASQILIKTGATALSGASVMAMVTNPYLVGGYGLYGFSTILLILALRDGELSVLYPVISLTFVWVALLSTVFFGEVLSPMKLLGILTIVAGVAVLGGGAKK
ncbi:MAG: hypothetical protein JNK48_22040 [Bryobacterales bacterium]|nr:hypothetical protein [Bryobacterales bacterium]